MPETKNKTLEEIDVLFSQPTGELVRENLRNVKQTTSDLVHLRWGRVFKPVLEPKTVVEHSDEESALVIKTA